MLQSFHSNRYEILVERLGQLVIDSGAGPLQQQAVVVPDPGVGRWIWLQLAGRHGIAANLEFILPGTFVWRLFHQLLPGVANSSPYQPEIMAWRLFRLMQGAQSDTRLDGIHHWLRDGDERRRYELAQQLARQFDQYIVYRPELLAAWGRGDGHHWQAELWRRLAADTGAADWLVLREQLEQVSAAEVAEQVGDCCVLFGLPLLSPGYFEVLQWLGNAIDVHLLLPDPCREYWGDIVAERVAARVGGDKDGRDLYLESGNSLLASLGAQARDLIDLAGDNAVQRNELYLDPGNDSVLHAVQGQVLRLEQGNGEQLQIASADRSIQVHVCHSPMREVEVLHDQLLGLLDADASLRPSEIIVMAPELERYAPYIDSVFGGSEPRLEFRLADTAADDSLVSVFFDLCQVGLNRFDANVVLGLLDTEPMRRRFGIDTASLANLRKWVSDTGVRWGLDATSRTGLSGQAAKMHTWENGLRRMLVGWAMPENDAAVFDDTLPYSEIGGNDALTLGALAELVARLGQWHRESQQPRSATQWSDWLQRQFELFFEFPEAQEPTAQRLRNAFNLLAEQAAQAQFKEPVGFDVVCDWLSAQLQSVTGGWGFLGHGITFCELRAMRNVPARVIVLMGMSYERFPRRSQARGFDLIARHPRRGDRSRRDDDRHAFLECLLNARDVFYISYTGRGIHDDKPRPPSVLVDELLDYLDRHFVAQQQQLASEWATVRHPLHGFSQRYFDNSDARLFSYCRSRATASAVHRSDELPSFVDLDSTVVPAELSQVTIRELAEFFANPARYWCRKRLGIDYRTYDALIDTEDPVAPGGLQKWQINDQILQLMEQGMTRDAIMANLTREAIVPAGVWGQQLVARLYAGCSEFFTQVETLRRPAREGQVHGRLEMHGISLEATLVVSDDGYFDYRHGSLRAQDVLSVWLNHLALQLFAPAEVARCSTWLSPDSRFTLTPVGEARRLLLRLLELYVEGVSLPLPFFPSAGWAYYQKIHTGQPEEQARQAALRAFWPSQPARGFHEGDDPYIRRVFSNQVIPERCFELAMEIFAPIYAAGFKVS